MAKLKAKINGLWTEIGAEAPGTDVPSTASLLKGDGTGGIVAAAAGTDYQAPLGAGDITASMLNADVWSKIQNDYNLSTRKYGEIINKPFSFSGSTIVFFGDSITAGVISGEHEPTDKGYAVLFCDMGGATMSNSAASGSTTVLRDQSTRNSVYNFIENASTVRGDYIVIAGGTNDYYYQIPLGKSNSTTPTELYGGLNEICRMLQTKAANVPVIFITPINKPTKPTATTKIYSLDDYRNAIFEVAASWGHSVVDGASLGFPDKHGANLNTFSYKMIYDGVHPTVEGHKMYARSLAGKLL